MVTSLTFVGDDALPSAVATDLVSDRPEGGWIWVDVSGENEATIREVHVVRDPRSAHR